MWVVEVLGDGAANLGSLGAGTLASGSEPVGRIGLFGAGLLVGTYLLRLVFAWLLLGVSRLGRPDKRNAWRHRLVSTALRLAPAHARVGLLRWSGVPLATGVVLGAGTAAAAASEPSWPSLDRGIVHVTAPPAVSHFAERAPAVRPSVGSLRVNRHVRPESINRGVVVVRRGDTLWAIAARHLHGHRTDARIARAWPQWYRLNRRVIGADPNLILPGMRLRIPSSSDEVTR